MQLWAPVTVIPPRYTRTPTAWGVTIVRALIFSSIQPATVRHRENAHVHAAYVVTFVRVLWMRSRAITHTHTHGVPLLVLLWDRCKCGCLISGKALTVNWWRAVCVRACVSLSSMLSLYLQAVLTARWTHHTLRAVSNTHTHTHTPRVQLSICTHARHTLAHTYQDTLPAYSLFASGLFNISADPSNPIIATLRSRCACVRVRISEPHRLCWRAQERFAWNSERGNQSWQRYRENERIRTEVIERAARWGKRMERKGEKGKRGGKRRWCIANFFVCVELFFFFSFFWVPVATSMHFTGALLYL